MKRILDANRLILEQETDFTVEAAAFLTEDRFGKTYDAQVRQSIVEQFPKLFQYEGYDPQHAELAVDQLRADILFMGTLYRNGEAVYKQLVTEKSP